MKPIITEVLDEIKFHHDNGILRAVQNVGIDVDKERLTKALVDSRSFYNEGYEDARQKYDANIKDFSCIIVCAFRYALGRMTYVPSIVAEFIKTNIDKIETMDIMLMIKEITEYGYDGYLGMVCDAVLWTNLREFLVKELDNRDERI